MVNIIVYEDDEDDDVDDGGDGDDDGGGGDDDGDGGDDGGSRVGRAQALMTLLTLSFAVLANHPQLDHKNLKQRLRWEDF